MNKWSEIKQATLDKMFISVEDATAEDYLKYMGTLANEALSFISNDKKALIRNVEVDYKPIIKGLIPQAVKFKMLSHFLTYSDYDITRTYNNEFEQKPEVIFSGDKRLTLIDYGLYNIYFNAFYFDIPKVLMEKDYDLSRSYTQADLDILEAGGTLDDEEDSESITLTLNEDGTLTRGDTVREEEIIFYGIDQSVIACLPNYIASQILILSEPQRATLLRNEFEIMLERLETDTPINSVSSKSIGGW